MISMIVLFFSMLSSRLPKSNSNPPLESRTKQIHVRVADNDERRDKD